MSIQRYDFNPISLIEEGYPETTPNNNDGQIVYYTDHAAEVERLTAERDALQSIVTELSHGLGVPEEHVVSAVKEAYGKYHSVEAERDALADDVAKAKTWSEHLVARVDFLVSERDAAVARAEKAEDQLATIFGLAFDSEVGVCGKDFALEQIRKISFGDTTIPHPGNDWRKRAARSEEMLRGMAAKIAESPGAPISVFRDSISAALAAAPQPITVQAAPSDRERRLEEALRRISNGEVEVFDEDEGCNVLVAMDEEEMQDIAIAAIAAAPDKPQYAALSQEPWGGPEE